MPAPFHVRTCVSARESLSYFRDVPFEENGNWKRGREKGQDGCETGRKTKADEDPVVYERHTRHGWKTSRNIKKSYEPDARKGGREQREKMERLLRRDVDET